MHITLHKSSCHPWKEGSNLNQEHRRYLYGYLGEVIHLITVTDPADVVLTRKPIFRGHDKNLPEEIEGPYLYVKWHAALIICLHLALISFAQAQIFE